MRRSVLDRDALLWNTLKDGVALEYVVEADDQEGWAKILCTDHRTGELAWGAEGQPETVVVHGTITFRHLDHDPRPVKEQHADGSLERRQKERQEQITKELTDLYALVAKTRL